MRSRIVLIVLAMLVSIQFAPAMAREGDTLLPLEIEAPPLETYPEDMLAESDFDAIAARVNEARISGAPLAVRIIDMTQETSDLPFPIRQYAREDYSQPFSEERKAAIAEAWAKNETVETSPDADDGFVLLILVPEDRTQSQAIWYFGENALPLNGLTAQNIQQTLGVINKEFSEGNVPNGVYLGISEFSFNVQFGNPERIERSELGEALNKAVYPLAIVTGLAGVAVPVLAWWLARKNNRDESIDQPLTPWHAASLQLGRAHSDITAAMLLDAIHSGSLVSGKDGAVQVVGNPGNPAVATLLPFANEQGVMPSEAMLEVEAITTPVRTDIQNDLATSGAFTDRVLVDRTWMLIAMVITLLAATMTAVPTVVSMNRIGVYGIAIALLGIFAGWWWLANRDYTSPAGKVLLADWLERASAREREQYDAAVHMDLFTDQVGGPIVNPQTRLVRQLRGLSAG